jgi:3-oxoadipate enol-lactonase
MNGPNRPEARKGARSTLKVNNLKFNTEVIGEGFPLVWGHGLMGSMAVEDRAAFFDWRSISAIARVVRYDARGHGRSDPTFSAEDYRWANLAHDMLGIADHCGFDRFAAGGLSMGCATTLFAALAAPKRVAGMVLVIPPTAWETRASRASFLDQMADLIDAEGVEALIRQMGQGPLRPAWQLRARPDLDTLFLNTLRSFDPKVLAQVLRGARLCDLPSREEIKTLLMPALILAWEDDPTHPLETAVELNRLLPASRLVVARSMAEIATWTREIKEFLSGLS